MKKFLSPATLLLFLFCSCGDNIAEIPEDSTDGFCSCNDSLINENRKFVYPFDDTNLVAVAYEYARTSSPHADSLRTGGMFNESDMAKVDTLSHDERVELKYICLNRGKPTCVGDLEFSNCGYFPHHCIVFYDSTAKAKAYLEVCFLCTGNRVWPDQTFGSRCGDFYDDLRYFYLSVGFEPEPLVIESAVGYFPDTAEIWKGHY